MPREPALRNTCRCPRTSLPRSAFHPTDHVQQDIHPTDNPPLSARKSGAGEARRRVGRRRGRPPSSTPPKSACAGDTVLRTSTRGTVPMGQDNGCHRGQHLTLHISTNNLHCENRTQMASPRPEHAHASARPATATPTPRPPHPRQQDGGKTDVLSSANGPSTVALSKDVTAHPHRPGARPDRPCPVPACSSHCPAREDSAPHCGTLCNLAW
jgi:hypothetical protein